MNMRRQFLPSCVSLLLTAVLLACLGNAQAQMANPAGTPSDKPPMKAEELEQLLAPIALYPDSLLTQVLMASTYPIEVVQADRWTKEHKDLKGDALAVELEKQSWDESVKSLVNFPDVLNTMSEKLDVTMKLGDAFIGQQKDVLNTVQVLRSKAQKEGNLKTTEQMKVSTAPMPPPEAPPAGEPQTVVVQQAPPQIITIESSDPEVIYVPSYNPTVVYGSWPYPAYPPYPYYPPPPAGYWASNAISFGLGVACGAAWGYAWGNCNWGHGDCDIDVNRNTNFNRNIDRSKAQAKIDARRTEGGRGQGGRGTGQGGRNTWQHDPAHRKGASYRDNKTASKFGGVSDRQASQAREAYRGRADAGRQNLARDTAGGRYGQGGAGQNRPGAGGAGQARPGGLDRPGAGAGQDRPGGAARPSGGSLEQARPGGGQNRPGAGGSGIQNRPGGAQERPGGAARPSQTPANRGSSGVDRPSSGNRSSAFDGANRSGSSARSASQRGQSSRSSSVSSRGGGGGSRSAPSRGGGGGGRSGGGGRGGGGGRR
jgi:hypothetical protein